MRSTAHPGSRAAMARELRPRSRSLLVEVAVGVVLAVVGLPCGRVREPASRLVVVVPERLRVELEAACRRSNVWLSMPPTAIRRWPVAAAYRRLAASARAHPLGPLPEPLTDLDEVGREPTIDGVCSRTSAVAVAADATSRTSAWSGLRASRRAAQAELPGVAQERRDPRRARRRVVSAVQSMASHTADTTSPMTGIAVTAVTPSSAPPGSSAVPRTGRRGRGGAAKREAERRGRAGSRSGRHPRPGRTGCRPGRAARAR